MSNVTFTPSVGVCFATAFQITLHLSSAAALATPLRLLFSYLPVTANEPPTALSSPTGYPLLTQPQEVMITTLTVSSLNISHSNTSLDVTVTAYLPPGVFTIVVHATSGSSNVSQLLYSTAAVTVHNVTLTPGWDLNEAVICSLLSLTEPDDPLSTLSELSSLTTTLIQADGLAALQLQASELAGVGCLNATSTNPNASSQNEATTVADALLHALLRSLENVTAASVPGLINSVNPISSALLSVLQALLSYDDSTGSPAVLTQLQGEQLLSAASTLVSTLSASGSAVSAYSAGITSLADLYGTLMSANSDQHCQLMQGAQDGISSLLSVAMTNQSTSEPKLLYSSPAFTATSVRLPVTSNQTTDVGGLQMQIPAVSLATLSASTVDVQLLVLASNLSWLDCFPVTVSNSQPLSSDVAGGSVLDTSLFSLSLFSTDGTELTVSDLPAPITWQLPYTFSSDSSSGTIACAFFNASLQAWSTDGCSSSLLSDAVGCSCNHLTPFSLITVPDSSATAGSVANAADADKSQPALYAVWLLYLIPMITASILLLRLLGCCHGSPSDLPHAGLLYAVIIVAAMVRCADSAVLCFGWSQRVLQTVDKDTVAVVSAALLFLPLVAETASLMLLLHRYVRLSQRGQTAVSWQDKRLQLSKPWWIPALLLVVCVVAAAIYLPLMERTDVPLLLLLACVALSSLGMLIAWLLQLQDKGGKLAGGEASSREGAALGGTAQLFHLAQAVLLLVYTRVYAFGDSWYVNSPLSGTFAPLTVYCVMEVVQLETAALLIRWLVSAWQRSAQDGVFPLSEVEQRRLRLRNRPAFAGVTGRRRKGSVLPSGLRSSPGLRPDSLSIAGLEDGGRSTLLAPTARAERGGSRSEVAAGTATNVRKLELTIPRDEGTAAIIARPSVSQPGSLDQSSPEHAATQSAAGLRSSPQLAPVRAQTATAVPPLVQLLMANRSSTSEWRSGVASSNTDGLSVLPSAVADPTASQQRSTQDDATSALAASPRWEGLISPTAAEPSVSPRFQRAISINASVSFVSP